MDVEMLPAKKPRKAKGEAPKAAAAAAAATAVSVCSPALFDEEEKRAWLERMSKPVVRDVDLLQREKELEEFLSGRWEMFRDNWVYGGFPVDAVTTFPCMRFTDADLNDPINAYHRRPRDTLQIVSVQVRALNENLHWPLDVYGFVAIHDVLDRKRIMVFDCKREDCQTIKKQDSYLRLSGPTRGVVVGNDASFIEVVLKSKGLTESADEDLSKFATTIRVGCLYPIKYTSKLCTLEMQHYTVLDSVEATVSVRVFEGHWPHGFQGVLNATTAGQEDIQISLLDFNGDELSVDADGVIKLSRKVVCVEHDGTLVVSLFENGVGEEGAVSFAAEKSRRTTCYMNVKKYRLRLEVVVAWSLF